MSEPSRQPQVDAAYSFAGTLRGQGASAAEVEERPLAQGWTEAAAAAIAADVSNALSATDTKNLQGPPATASAAPAGQAAPDPPILMTERKWFCTVLTMACGFGMLTGGVLAFIYALKLQEVDGARVNVHSLGPLNGLWAPTEFGLLGAMLTAVGSGLFVLGLGWLVLAKRSGESPFRRRRSLIQAGLLTAVLGGLGVAASFLLYTEKIEPVLSDAERNKGRALALLYLESPDKSLLTEECARRTGAAAAQTTYHGQANIRTWSFASNEVLVVGELHAAKKETHHTTAQGSTIAVVVFQPAKRVGFSIRLVQTENRRWLIDDVSFAER